MYRNYRMTDIYIYIYAYTRYIYAGGGGTQVHKGAAPALRISRKKGSFLRPPHVRDFVKEGYFFVPRYEVWGEKIPLQSTKYRWL